MTGSPPVPAGNVSPYPLHPPGHDAPRTPVSPVIRTPEPGAPDPSGVMLAAFGVALIAGGAAIVLALSERRKG